MWLSTDQQDLKEHHLMPPEATDLAQNRPLWRMMSMYGAMQSWVARQKRRRCNSKLEFLCCFLFNIFFYNFKTVLLCLYTINLLHRLQIKSFYMQYLNYVQFLSHVSILMREIDTGILSVCPSICLSIRNVPILDENGLTYCHCFFTIR